MDYSKINRLVIVGNGFDLMHGLKTSFYDFINYCAFEVLKTFAYEFYDKDSYSPYVIDCALNIKQCIKFYNDLKKSEFTLLDATDRNNIKELTDELLSTISKHEIAYDPNTDYCYISYDCISSFYYEIESIHKDFILKQSNSIHLNDVNILNNKLFNFTLKSNSSSNWGGIESDYYAILLHTSKIEIKSNLNKFRFDDSYKIDDLNREFSQIISYFEKYITLITSEEIINKNNLLLSHLNSPIDKREVINSVSSKIGTVGILDLFSDSEPKRQIGTKNIDTTLFVNFNYTHTVEQYIQQLNDEKNYQHIQIHGELNNFNNPIIFGYGDELDDSYKKLENQNNNDCLRYAKAMHYLTTNNYKNLLNFLDQNYYQIYIWGHSCSLSDRVLLNTLFEHKNCISIKPFYHKKEDGTDNYTDLCTNISRSFKDKKLFRDVVVNKEYCEPLSKSE